jgi:hypothetical protein
LQLSVAPARAVLFSTKSTADPVPAKATPSSVKQTHAEERTAVPKAEPRTLFVKREGDAAWAEVTAEVSISVARLTKEIVKELPSLRDKDLSTLTLHVAKDKAGTDLEAALDSTDTIEEALSQHAAMKKTRIVVKVAGAGSAAPAAAGLDAAGTSRARVQARRAPGVRMTGARSLPLAASTCCRFCAPNRARSGRWSAAPCGTASGSIRAHPRRHLGCAPRPTAGGWRVAAAGCGAIVCAPLLLWVL